MSPLSLSLSLARTQPRPRRRRTPPARRRALVLRSVVTLNVLSLSLSRSLSLSLCLTHTATETHQNLLPASAATSHSPQSPEHRAASAAVVRSHRNPASRISSIRCNCPSRHLTEAHPASTISISQYCPQETKFLRLIAEDQASALEEPPSAKDMHQQYRAAAGDPAKYLSCPSADSKQLYHTSTL